MKISDKFTNVQKNILEDLKININIDFNKDTLEELEEKIYNAMMDNLDENQDYMPKAIEIEKILDIVVEIENNL